MIIYDDLIEEAVAAAATRLCGIEGGNRPDVYHYNVCVDIICTYLNKVSEIELDNNGHLV